MKPLQECLELARGRSPQEFIREHPHPVLIGLGVLPGELQRNPAKASGTLYLSLSPDQPTSGATSGDDALVNQVFEVRRRSDDGGERIEIGGTVESDVDIPDHTVSRNHAWFLVGGGVVRLIDGGSTNGTFINGTRLTPDTPTPIKSGDILTFGRYSFTYYDAMAFAKLLSVQAMMRPRGAGRRPPPGRPTAQLGGGGPPRPGTAPRPGGGRTPVVRRPLEEAGADRGQPGGRPSPGRVVDPFLGPPREGRFTTPEEARRAAATTDPRRAFPPGITLGDASQKRGEAPPAPTEPAAPAQVPAKPGLLARAWTALKRLVRWLLGMG